jgi:hypothetical protein
MKKKGHYSLELCAQERSILISILIGWQNAFKKLSKTNATCNRDNAYVEKLLSRLLGKKRCVHCGEWM